MISATGNANVGNIGATRGVFTNIVGTLETAAQPNITSVGTLTSVSVSGNAVVGNLNTAGKISATGDITGNAGIFNGGLQVTGNIDATGNLNYQNVTDLVVGDPLIYIGANNSGNLFDLGLVASYNDGSYYHTGLARNHNNGIWTFFDGVVNEPTTVIDWANATYPTIKMGALQATTTISATGNIDGGNLRTVGLVTATGNVTGGN